MRPVEDLINLNIIGSWHVLPGKNQVAPRESIFCLIWCMLPGPVFFLLLVALL